MPPPGSVGSEDSLRHRPGYRALQQSSGSRVVEEDFAENQQVVLGDTEDSEERIEQEERETVRREGWRTLGVSFSASAGMTVR